MDGSPSAPAQWLSSRICGPAPHTACDGLVLTTSAFALVLSGWSTPALAVARPKRAKGRIVLRGKERGGVRRAAGRPDGAEEPMSDNGRECPIWERSIWELRGRSLSGGANSLINVECRGWGLVSQGLGRRMGGKCWRRRRHRQNPPWRKRSTSLLQASYAATDLTSATGLQAVLHRPSASKHKNNRKPQTA